MRSVAEDVDEMHARWVLEDAQVRAMARRQLSHSAPIVIAGAFVAVISTFSFGRSALPSSPPQHAPISAPASHHVSVLVSGTADQRMKGRAAGPVGSLRL
jgi:hypothetical protein